MIRETGVLVGRNVRISLSRRSFFQLIVSPLVFFGGFHLVLNHLLSSRGVDFAQFLTPAIVMMAMGLAAVSTGFFIARDRSEGMLNRCRTLPINGLSILLARIATDALRCLVPIAAIVAVGYAIGFRFSGLPAAVGFVALAVAFALSFCLGAAALALRSDDPESIASALFLPMLPLLNLSTVFAPLSVFPDWLEPVIRINPYSATVDALRALADGQPVSLAPPLIWIAALWLVFGLAVSRAFRRA
ncbi:ABC transporter permease [Nonomuraea purpurea]|uniref:ABC transporter permease n=1 Tax=Nonomuraea purpurea TaxID=1849276 RepID=A0ABV8GMG8_9ACTN